MPDFKEQLELDLLSVESRLKEQLTGSYLEELINSMCLQMVSAGGKRLRPKLALLCAGALNEVYSINKEDVIDAAAGVELLHNATLIHDDVIDKATVRRGVATINETDGNHAAVLCGDYLCTRCFLLFIKLNNPKIFEEGNNTLAALVKGEINQMANQGNLETTISDYEETIYCKTGALFELASTVAAMLVHAEDKYTDALREYGKQLGIAFQVADDMLDYSSDTKTLGKTIGEDLSDGRVTLPLILALKSCGADDLAVFKDAIENDRLDEVLKYIKKTDALRQCEEFALKAADKANEALMVLPPSKARDMLCELSYKAVKRLK